MTGREKIEIEEKESLQGFYTFKEYQYAGGEGMTSSMEDYLEMICRMEASGQPVRVGALAKCLHVRPSSVSKMLENLRRSGYIQCRKYGLIHLTEHGKEEGEYLLYRHQVLHAFFCALNGTGDELEQVEKIEHFLDRRTVRNMERATELLAGNIKKSIV